MFEGIQQLRQECIVANVAPVVHGHAMDGLRNEALSAGGHAECEQEENGTDECDDRPRPLHPTHPSSSIRLARHSSRRSSQQNLRPHAVCFGMVSPALSRCKIVALVMIGFAQKPTLRTHPNVRYRKATPARSPAKSPMRPMMSGTTAPPMIPVLKIPANGP